jgi:hypothetical protein
VAFNALEIAALAIIVFVVVGLVIALVTHGFVPNMPPSITTQPSQSI